MTDQYKAAENKRATEKELEKRLNRAKTNNPPSVLNALNISTGWLGHKITVTWANGRYYAGAGTDEFQYALGMTSQEADETLKAKGL